jgi:hypothetical protein
VKVLLDENLDHGLRKHLSGHDVVTVRFMGWAGLKNGELLRAAEDNGVEVLVTGDRTLNYEQNLTNGDWQLWRFRLFSYLSSTRTFQRSSPPLITLSPVRFRRWTVARSAGRRPLASERNPRRGLFFPQRVRFATSPEGLKTKGLACCKCRVRK